MINIFYVLKKKILDMGVGVNGAATEKEAASRVYGKKSVGGKKNG